MRQRAKSRRALRAERGREDASACWVGHGDIVTHSRVGEKWPGSTERKFGRLVIVAASRCISTSHLGREYTISLLEPETAVSFFASREETMIATDSTKYLRVALLLVGVIFIIGIYPLTIIWPSGWSWHPGQSDYLQMILGIYATLGVFLLVASRNPLAHLSLIWFTIWSSVVHGGIMAVQSLANSEQMGHLWGDVLALFVVAAVLALLTPRGAATKPALS